MEVILKRGGDGRVGSLLIQGVHARGTPRKLLGRLQGFAEQHGHLLTRNGEVVASHNADRPLAIGSAFKIFVLRILVRAIAAGKTGWPQILTLKDHHRSLPSGSLQDWPDGHSLTVETAALLMISQSDNTATDLLMDHLGSLDLSLESVQGALLTTHQFFQLKINPAGAVLHDNASSEKARKTLMETLKNRPLPEVPPEMPPYQPGLEWYASSEELCAALAAVAHLPLFTVNPGLAARADWSAIAFKGGSETGVLSHSYVLTQDDSTVWCFSASWNQSSALDEEAIHAVISGLLAHADELAPPPLD